MMSNKLRMTIYIVLVIFVISAIFLIKLKPGNISTSTPSNPSAYKQEYYGSSTFGPCASNNDCFVNGCNSEICQSKSQESLVSICITPDKPTAKDLGYTCGCVEAKCQWQK